MKEDVTSILERLPEHKARCGVRFEGVYAELETIDGYPPTLIVRGEAHALTGSAIDAPVEVRANAYSQSGRVISSGTVFIDADNFFEFETIEIFMLDLESRPSRVRLFLKFA